MSSSRPTKAELLARVRKLEEQNTLLAQQAADGTAALRKSLSHLQRQDRERKRTEHFLRFTQLAVAHAAEAAYWMGEDARLIYVNDATCRSLGYTRDELLTMSVHDINPNLPPGTWGEHWAKIRKEGAFTVESVHRTKDGRVLPVEIAVSYQQFEGKGYSCAFARDITERKRGEREIQRLNEGLEKRVTERTGQLRAANRRLRHEVQERQKAERELTRVVGNLARSNRELQDFAYVASHDLREPLRKVQAFGERLHIRYGTKLDERGNQYLDRMINAAERMENLIHALLSYSRVTTRGHTFGMVRLTDILQEAGSNLELAIQRSAATVRVGELPEIFGDSTQLVQLFQNLMQNAIKFARPNVPPEIRVQARVSDGQCTVEVRDNGIGFDSRHTERIFTIFQRLHTRAEYEGTGIGLAICRRIAERHGGTIAASGQPGQGATFCVTLPVDPPEME